MTDRMRLGTILTGATIAYGLTFCISLFFRALAGQPQPLPPLSTWQAFGGILAVTFSFAVGGAATVLLGRFRFRSHAALHSLAACLLAVLAIHYFTRGSLFIGRPGYSFGTNYSWEMALGRVVPFTPFVSWAIAFSCLASLVASVFSGLVAFRWLESNQVWGERVRPENLRKVA
jgi:hypothetical protein